MAASSGRGGAGGRSKGAEKVGYTITWRECRVDEFPPQQMVSCFWGHVIVMWGSCDCRWTTCSGHILSFTKSYIEPLIIDLLPSGIGKP